jgi:hypothetical protein
MPTASIRQGALKEQRPSGSAPNQLNGDIGALTDRKLFHFASKNF